jgi:hypothetical protein
MTAPPIVLSGSSGQGLGPARPGAGEPTPTGTWLDYVHPDVKRYATRWRYVWDLYTGECVDPGNVPNYLVRRATGEHADSYGERCRMADYTNHLSALVDSLSGMLAAVERSAVRKWMGAEGEPAGVLGDPKVPGTLAERLTRNASGDGDGWATIWRRVSPMLFLLRRSWVLTDTAAPGVPMVRLLSPWAVRNWMEDDKTGVLTEALLVEDADARASLHDEPDGGRTYLYLRVEGWQRLRPVKDSAVEVVEEGPWSYVTRDGTPTIPLSFGSLPIARDVGYVMARKCNAIFNKESERDHLLRYGNSPRFMLDAPDETQFNKLVDSLVKGSSVLQGVTHKWVAPDVGPAEVASKVLERKVEEFYRTGFREYADSAAQKTATEVRQDVAAGLGAVLSLARTALDDLENDVLWFLEQTVAPANRANWGVAHVIRSDDFAAPNPDEAADKLVASAFGTADGVPMGATARVAAARRYADAHGLAFDESEATAAVRAAMVSSALAANPVLTMPATVRADYAVDVAIAAGYVKSEDVAGVAALKAEALALARVADESARRATEGFPGPSLTG